jgi:bifunctional non-homologous end joining protein LigD
MTTALPPAGLGWLHEIKYDGFRMLARRENERVRLFTRNAYDWTERYPLVAEAIGALKARSLIRSRRSSIRSSLDSRLAKP